MAQRRSRFVVRTVRREGWSYLWLRELALTRFAKGNQSRPGRIVQKFAGHEAERLLWRRQRRQLRPGALSLLLPARERPPAQVLQTIPRESEVGSDWL